VYDVTGSAAVFSCIVSSSHAGSARPVLLGDKTGNGRGHNAPLNPAMSSPREFADHIGGTTTLPRLRYPAPRVFERSSVWRISFFFTYLFARLNGVFPT